MTLGQTALDAFQRSLAAGRTTAEAWEDAGKAVADSAVGRAVMAITGQTPFGISTSVPAPQPPTLHETLSDPARYAGTRWDPVMQPVPYQILVGPGGFVQDHAEGDTWNPPHEPFHESEQNFSVPTTASAFLWCHFYRGNSPAGGAPKSAKHWLRLKDRDQNFGIDSGAGFMDAFIAKLAPSQKAACGIA